MHINALLNSNGQITFPIPLRIKTEPVKVEIIIPDNAIETMIPRTTRENNKHSISIIRQQINDILGEYAYERPMSCPADDKMAWHQHLEQKYTIWKILYLMSMSF